MHVYVPGPTPEEARRICNAIWFHAGPCRQRVLLSAVSYDRDDGYPDTPTAISVETEEQVNEAYVGLRETCRDLGIDPDDIITKSWERFWPGPLTMLANSWRHVDHV